MYGFPEVTNELPMKSEFKNHQFSATTKSTHSIKFGGEVGCFLVLIVQLIANSPALDARF